MTLAIIFDSVGAGEWLVLLAVLLIVMGPKRLPSTMRKVGAYYSKFRRAADSFKRQLMDMDLEMERELRKVEQEAEDAMKIDEPEGKKPDGEKKGEDGQGEDAKKPDGEEAADEGADPAEEDYDEGEYEYMDRGGYDGPGYDDEPEAEQKAETDGNKPDQES